MITKNKQKIVISKENQHKKKTLYPKIYDTKRTQTKIEASITIKFI